MLVDQHIQKLEKMSARFDALVQQTETIADQVAAWGNLQSDPMRLGTIYRVDGALNQMTDSLGSSSGTLAIGWLR